MAPPPGTTLVKIPGQAKRGEGHVPAQQMPHPPPRNIAPPPQLVDVPHQGVIGFVKSPDKSHFGYPFLRFRLGVRLGQ
mgnify:CR=1 FL=1